jgi:hypothetical protein
MSADSHRAAGWVTVDWTIIALSLLAVGLLLATTIRTDPVRLGAAPDAVGGLRMLSPEERLVAFEDFSFGTHGWSIAGAERATETVPSLLGPFHGGALEKSYSLPGGTIRVSVTLDLYVSDAAAAESLVIDLNDAPVLLGLSPLAADGDGHVASVEAPDGSGARNPWTVRIDVAEPGATLTLGLRNPDAGDGSWGLDNVWVVAETAALGARAAPH